MPEHYTIVAPMRIQENFLSIIAPFSYEVWMCFLICIPLYVLAMSAMNYHFNGRTDWETVASTVIRGVLSDCKSTNMKPPKHMYQMLLHLFWFWMMLVLISAYQGNLLAMITKPAMNTPFINAAGMVDQTLIKWGVWKHDSLFASYAKSKPVGTTLRKIIDKAIKCADAFCTKEAKVDKDMAIICGIAIAGYVKEIDYSKTGTCNYYLTEDKILSNGNALAIQASYSLNT